MRVRDLVGVGAIAIVAICAASFAGWAAHSSAVAQASATPYGVAGAGTGSSVDGSAATATNPPATVSPAPSTTPDVTASASGVPVTAPVVNGAAAAEPLGMLMSNAEPLPVCSFGGTVTPLAGQNDWNLTLVDTYYRLPTGYQPDGLVAARAAGINSGEQVRSLMIPDLARLAAAATAAGAPLGIVSAYRGFHTQVYTFGHWQNLLGFEGALGSSARPGHSEHQLGLAIDFKSRGGDDPWTFKDWAKMTPAGIWMAANAWKYGFVMSYPRGKAALTCYQYEPWHYRYVGVAEAAAIHASGMVPRQWLWMHQPNPESPSP